MLRLLSFPCLLHSYLHHCFSSQGFHQALKNELVTKQTNFAQPTGKPRTVLAKEIAFVIAGQFSRGKEKTEQEYYYETMAMQTNS